MKPYKKLKFNLDVRALNECKRLPYYEYEDRDLKESVLGCAVKSIDGRPSNLFKKVPDLCSSYRLTSIAAQLPTITKYITSFNCGVGRVRILKYF